MKSDHRRGGIRARRWIGVLALVISAAVAGSSSAHAQRGAFIRGHVIDNASDRPVPGAIVELVNADGRPAGRQVSDSTGQFALPAAAGRFTLTVAAVSYVPTTTSAIDLAASDTVNVIVRVSTEPMRLPALEVVAASRPVHLNPALQGYYHRMRQGLGGTFITREEIDRRGPSFTSEILSQAGAIVTGHPLRANSTLHMGRTGCAPLVYLDGVNLIQDGRGPRDRQALQAVNLIHPSGIHGIEVYRGAATIPAEFGGSDARCGVIVIWTRRGP